MATTGGRQHDVAATDPADRPPAESFPLPPDAQLSVRAALRALRTFHTGMGEIRAAGGPVTMVRFGPRRLFAPIAVVTSPRGARDVLAGSDNPFDKQGAIHHQARVLGTNVFSMANEPWRARRRALQPLFTKKHVAGYAGHMAAAAAVVSREMIRDGAVDLDVACRRLTLRVVGRSMFGRDLGEQALELGPAIRTSLSWVTGRAMRPVRAPTWLPTPARHRLRTARDLIRRLIDSSIDAAISAADHAVRENDADRSDLIDLLLDTEDPTTGLPLTREAIREELVAFLVAGHDTTATTLAYSLWALGRDAALQQRVADEIAAVGDRPLDVADVTRLPLTVQVIHETLRMCPPAAVVTRMAMHDAVVDGFRIPAGTDVIVGIYTLHRDPDGWDHPDSFDPDRFSPARSAGRDRWQYLPFGGGPRTCIGDHFAMLEAALALATVVQMTEIHAHDDAFPVALPFTLTAGAPIRATVSARRQS